MPRGDRTGPDGMGPMTGRRLGFCNGYDSPGFTKGFPRGGGGYGFNRHWGRGMRFNRGMGYGRGYYPAPAYPSYEYSEQDEVKYLENEVKALSEQLNALQTRLSELKAEE